MESYVCCIKQVLIDWIVECECFKHMNRIVGKRSFGSGIVIVSIGRHKTPIHDQTLLHTFSVNGSMVSCVGEPSFFPKIGKK